MHTQNTISMRSLTLLAIGLLFTLNEAVANATDPGDQALLQARPLDLYSESYALVIGIDDYNNGWPRLSNAVEDAKSVAAQLSQHGYQVDLKTDLDGNSLKETLRNFFILRGANPKARLLLWFAGHGQTIKDEGFLVARDTPKQSDPSFKLSAIHMRDFGSWVRLAESKHVLAIFDSCFSGTIFSSQRGNPPAAITRATTFPVRQFITSGDANQLVSDNGTFRELFIRALDGKEPADVNSDGYLTASELGFFLSDRVTNLTQAQQTPRYGKLRDKDYDRGDFILTAIKQQSQLIQDTAKVQSIETENLHWKSAMMIDSKVALQAYLTRYPNGNYADLAHARLEQLGKAQPQAKPKNKPVSHRSALKTLNYTAYTSQKAQILKQPKDLKPLEVLPKGEAFTVVGSLWIDDEEWLQLIWKEHTAYMRAAKASTNKPRKSMAELIKEAKNRQNLSGLDPNASKNDALNAHKKKICLRDCRDFAYFNMDQESEAKAKEECRISSDWNESIESCMASKKQTWQNQNKLKCEQKCQN